MSDSEKLEFANEVIALHAAGAPIEAIGALVEAILSGRKS